ncbi:MAG: DNRLRE domain-containing protein [candidate division Zixibacteria bacterium]|nr:DNRLRE domain-containing protein [candidate division Zixibacteria bacterium]
MLKSMQFIALLMLIAFTFTACSTDSTINGPSENSFQTNLSLNKIIIPESAVFESATLYLYVSQANGQPINVHRITEPWNEMTATWNNFDGQYNMAVEGTFTADALGWASVDVSGLLINWMNGSTANYGLLLDQVEMKFPWAHFNSREATENQPYLEICYTTSDGLECETTLPLADTYIYETMPDVNIGWASTIRTGFGYFDALEKQALLIFDIPEMPEEPAGCTNTIGYWKNHAGFGPQDDMVTPLLPIWLGTDEGTKSIFVKNARTAKAILKMKTFGHPRNGITKLYAQLLAAKLNIAAGASDTDVENVIKKADRFLDNKSWKNWYKMSQKKKKRVLRWMKKLDRYNNGIIGPGHCE